MGIKEKAAISEKRKKKGIIAGTAAGLISAGLYGVILNAFGASLNLGNGVLGLILSLLMGTVVGIMGTGLDTSTHNAQDREKKPDPLEKPLPSSGDAAVDARLEQALNTLQQIREENAHMEGLISSEQLSKLEEGCMAVFTAVAKNPGRAGQIRKLADYYLPTMQKMLGSCRKLSEAGMDEQQLAAAKERVVQLTDKLSSGCAKLLTQLYRDDVMDVNSDMDVLETMLRRDGLTESELDAAARQAVNAAAIDHMVTQETERKKQARRNEVAQQVQSAAEAAKNHVSSAPQMDGGTYYADAAAAQEMPLKEL